MYRDREKDYPNSNLRSRIDPITVGRGFGLPPTSKFRSGHLPSSAIPLSRPLPSGDSGLASEDDETTDSEDGIYGGRYSLESSPQNDRVANGVVNRYKDVLRRRPGYASDYLYSDVSSSVDTVTGRQNAVAERLMRGNGKYPIGQSNYMEDESSDSAASSEFSTTQVGSTNSGVPHNVASRLNVERTGKKARELQNERLSDVVVNDDIPSAPPYCGSTNEIRNSNEHYQAPKAPSNAGILAESGSRSELDKLNPSSGLKMENKTGKKSSDHFSRVAVGAEATISSGSNSARIPIYHASALGPWHAVLAYDACVRLCLNAWARGCAEAPMFLENECALLRESFGLQQILLQSEEELMARRSSELAGEAIAPKPKKIIGKMKVQVRKVKMSLNPPTGCSALVLRTPTVKMETIRNQLSNFQSTLVSGWHAIQKIHVSPRVPANSSFSRQSLAYVHAGTQYIKQVSGLLKVGVSTLRSSSTSDAVVQAETYTCLLRLKSSSEDNAIRMQPGSGETHIFFPDSLGDDLIIEVLDSKGKHCGRVHAQVATIVEDQADKLRWWSMFREPEHELIGKIQLYINYTTSSDDNLKCGSVAETVAYDLAMEVAMKVQHFQQRNLVLDGPWKWLLTEFASYYGVSDVYTKLRYLSYVMDVATPTADCLTLIYDLLMPVVMKGPSKSSLSHQENRILGEVKDQIGQILALVFENYKSLDESTLSGIVDVFRRATGIAAPALKPAVELYKLLHDVFSPESQTMFCHYFQVAAKRRSKRHLVETDEYVTNNSEGNLMDAVTTSTAYMKMKSLCTNLRNEIFTDIEIHNQDILPSFLDLPNLSASIYSTELCSRLRAFLIACPPTGPTPPVAELVIATADFQRDLASWKISPIKGGVDAKELFHLYIMVWIQDKRLSLLESCKLDKVKWSGVQTQHFTTPFVDDMYDRLKDFLSEYEVIICRWPEYTFALENAIADVEKAIVEALDKQYADVLSPLKENLAPKIFGLKYVQRLAKRSVCPYIVPEELAVLLNSLKRMLDVLRPKIENQFKSWSSCIPDGGNTAPGERLSEVTVMLRAKYKSYLQAIVEKLAENTKLQNSTKVKKILQDSKENVVEADVRGRIQPLKDQLTSTMSHLHKIFERNVFMTICREYWDRMGQDVLNFLENKKENKSWYKGSRIAVSILDDIFASHMQQLLGNTLQEKDLEAPRYIMEVHSMLFNSAPNHKNRTYY